jgi:hypothetical protein
MDETPENIFKLVASNDEAKEDGLPQFDYVIETTEGVIKEVYGFPVFSPQYIMIMQEFPGGITAPVFMMPIHFVKSFELEVEDEEEAETLPF